MPALNKSKKGLRASPVESRKFSALPTTSEKVPLVFHATSCLLFALSSLGWECSQYTLVSMSHNAEVSSNRCCAVPVCLQKIFALTYRVTRDRIHSHSTGTTAQVCVAVHTQRSLFLV